MEIFVLGSCSGTEPQAGRHHTSWVLRYRNELYWFDAGENCSYTAHLAGLDLLTSRAVFISHPHIDHIGGFPEIAAASAYPSAFDSVAVTFSTPSRAVNSSPLIPVILPRRV